MTIILDLDDVLANLRESLYRTLHAATGIDYHWRQWRHYDLTQHYALTKDALETILLREQALENCLPEPDAGNLTAALRQLGYKLHIITARGWHPAAERLTRDWLQRHAIQYDALDVVPLGSNKLDVLPATSEIRFAVDDHPNNIRRYASHGIASLLVDMPWNLDYVDSVDGIDNPVKTRRVHALGDVLAYARQLLK